MRLVVVAVFLLGTGRIELKVAMLSEEGASSEQWISPKEKCPRTVDFLEGEVSSGTAGDALREKLCLAYHNVCLREFLMR